MKKIYILIILSLIWNISISQKNTIIAGTLKNFYPINYTGKLGIPFSKNNPKSYTQQFFSPIFQSKDSFYYSISLNEPGIYKIFFNDIYLTPGDSIHFNYYFEDENKNLKDSFVNIFSKSGYNGNIGFSNFMKKKKLEVNTAINALKNIKFGDPIIDSLYSNLENELITFEKNNRISPEYKKILEKDLMFENLNSKIKIAGEDSAKLYRLLKSISYYVNGEDMNTEAYFIVLGDLPETLFNILKQPDSVISKLSEYLDGETLNYASLIFAKILQYKLPSYNNPYSNTIALHVLNFTTDSDLIKLSNSILNKMNDGNKINAIIQKIKVRNYENKIFTIGEILNAKSSKLKYLDFWASWCAPCIEGLPFTLNLSHKFGSTNISSILISIDEDPIQWKKTSDRIRIHRNESYCILDKSNYEALDSIMKISPIPHYILFDQNNKLQLLRAPEAKSINEEFISSFLRLNVQEDKPKNQLPPPPPVQ